MAGAIAPAISFLLIFVIASLRKQAKKHRLTMT